MNAALLPGCGPPQHLRGEQQRARQPPSVTCSSVAGGAEQKGWHRNQVPTTASSGVGGHPDALRRRLEAAARQRQRTEELQAFSQLQWWQQDMPDNMVAVSSPEEYLSLVRDKPLVVASFFVAWCTGCRRMSPKWKRIAANNPDITFASVNCGEGPLQALAESLGIAILPYFRFYKRGVCRTHLAANLTRVDRLRAEIAFLRTDSGLDSVSSSSSSSETVLPAAASGSVDLSGSIVPPVGPGGPGLIGPSPGGGLIAP